MAQTEDWFGLAGVAWLSGLLFLSLALAVYWACRRRSEPAVAALLVVLTLIACTSGISMRPQLVSYLLVVVDHRGVAARPGHRAGAVAPRAGHLGLDDVPRDVAGRDRDRRGRGARARPRPRPPAPHPGQDGRGAGAVGGGLAAHPGRSRALPGRAPRGLAGQVLLRVEPAGLHQALGRHAGRHPGARRRAEAAARRAGAVVRRAAARARGARGRSTRCAPCRSRPAWPLRSPRPPLQPLLGRAAVGAPPRAAARGRRLRARAGHARRPGAAHRGRAPRDAPRGSTARSATCPRAPGSSTTAASAAT